MAGKKVCSLIVISLIIFTAIGITIAYAATNASNTATNVVTIGNVKIVLHNQDDEEVNSHRQKIMPGDTISKIVSVENVGDYSAYIRVKVKREWLNNSSVKPLSVDAIVPSVKEGWKAGRGEDSDYVYYYYNKIVSATQDAIPFMDNYLVDASKIDNDTFAANQEDVVGKISVVAEAVQADYYTPDKDGDYIIGWPGVSFGADYVNSTPVATVVTQAAASSGSSVEFVGDSGSFVSFETGTDLFLNVKGLMPGQTVEQNISITNIYDNPVEVYLYAKIPDEYMSIARSNTEWELLNALRLVVRSGTEVIYEGSLFDSDSSKDMLSQEKAVFLGIFRKGEQHQLTASITLPGSWTKSYCQTKVDWVFTTKRITSTYVPVYTNSPVVTPFPIISPSPTIVPTEEPEPSVSPEPAVSPEVSASSSPTLQPTKGSTMETDDTPVNVDDSTPTVMPSETPELTKAPVPTFYREETVIPEVTPTDPVIDSGYQPQDPVLYSTNPTSSPVSETEEPDEIEETENPVEETREPELPPDKHVKPDLIQEHATKTGDETPILFWTAAFAISFIGVLFQLGYFFKKKRGKE